MSGDHILCSSFPAWKHRNLQVALWSYNRRERVRRSALTTVELVGGPAHADLRLPSCRTSLGILYQSPAGVFRIGGLTPIRLYHPDRVVFVVEQCN